MSISVNLRTLLCLLTVAFTTHAGARTRAPHAQAKHKATKHAEGLSAVIDKILDVPTVSHAHWGISVVTAEGVPVYSLNDGQFFAPASNAKLFTTAAAFGLLGPDFVAKTYVVQQGTLDARGRLAGSLRLEGTGDPSLSGRTYPYDGKTERAASPLHVLDELAAQVAASGIRQIDGGVVGDDTFFPAERYGSGWAWDDLEWGYGAPVSALTVNDNVVYLNLSPGGKLGDPAIVSWNPALPGGAGSAASLPGAPTPSASTPSPGTEAVPFYQAGNSIFTSGVGTPQQIGVDRLPGSRLIRLFGSIPLDSNGAHLALAIENPAWFAASAFEEMLTAHGVKVNGPPRAEQAAPADTRPFEERIREPLELHPLPGAATTLPLTLRPGEAIIATHTSPHLADEATVINKVSQNLHAELLLRQLGKSQTGDGSFVQGARVVRQFLVNAGVSGNDFLFYDGSGLSPKDQVAPRAMTTLLVYAARQPWGTAFRATLPIGGVDGSLSLRFAKPALRGKVFAKTGTLAEVNALSGYLVAASGRTLAFSILCNGRRPSSDEERKAIDQMVEAIAASN